MTITCLSQCVTKYGGRDLTRPNLECLKNEEGFKQKNESVKSAGRICLRAYRLSSPPRTTVSHKKNPKHAKK